MKVSPSYVDNPEEWQFSFSKVSHFIIAHSVTLTILYRPGVEIGSTFFSAWYASKKKDDEIYLLGI